MDLRCRYVNDVNSTDNSQPWKLKPAKGSWPGSILTFQDLRLTSCATWLASQNAQAWSQSQPKRPNVWTVWRVFIQYSCCWSLSLLMLFYFSCTGLAETAGGEHFIEVSSSGHEQPPRQETRKLRGNVSITITHSFKEETSTVYNFIKTSHAWQF